MTDDVKAPVETPVVPALPAEVEPKATPELSVFIDKRREELEQKVIAQNESHLEPEAESITVSETPVEELKSEEGSEHKSDVNRIKEKVQKRIDKEVAKRKTVEERLAETEAELARLKSQPSPEAPAKVDKDREPTDAEIRNALIKAREDGNVEFEAQILEFMTERKANRIADDRIRKIQDEQKAEQTKTAKVQSDWIELNRDYAIYRDDGSSDTSHDLNLANQKGLLYTTAMSLYQDPDLKDYYGDPDKIAGFRRAVSDAFREIHNQKLYKPKDNVEAPRTTIRKPVLAEPAAEVADESPRTEVLSDADKVREELKNRRAYQQKRAARY